MRYLLICLFVFFYTECKSQQLEAILILGNNLSNDRKISHLSELERISSFLNSKNVIVHKFYSNKAKWEDIIKVSPRCSFFIYFGHGGEKIFLNIDKYIDSNMIISDLRLKPNSIVLLSHCCLSAGSSSTDKSQISLSTARKRIMSRSSVFFKTGASVYYSNNFNDNVLIFLNNLYQGQSIESYHTNFINGGLYKSGISMVEELNEYYNDNIKKVFLYSDKIPSDKFRTYDICLIGDPKFNIELLK